MKTKTIKSIIVATGVLLFMSCGGKNQQQATVPQAPSLKVSTLKKQDITIYNSYSTNIQGLQNVEIWPKVAGFVQNIYVEEGQKVKKGQLLFKLETQTLSQDAEAAKAAVNLAQVEVDKLVPLVEKNIISEVQLETAKAQLEQAKSNYNSIAANIGYSNIVSPVNGYIGEIPYKVGALVSSTMGEPLSVVSDISSIRAYFSMTEKQLLQMKSEMADKGAPISSENTPEVELVMVNGETYPQKGKIAMVNNIINPTTGSVTLRADFDNPNQLLSSGSTGTIKVPSTYENTFVIPQFATVDLQGTKMVFILNDDNSVNTKPLNIVAQTDKEFIVNEGLEEGSTIVTEGVSKLKDGQTINPVKQ
ncbi:efflux RND transporter periplasmic adaptor subunit [Flagellimonas halotolerans]|uniref:Efflux RND transporter periplasmic adaptor subunit n=1 Tax=Flagellimonas halotolerans TaxID=3112164 RepID=A0ABU6IU81_9FLAO|nr:MULTISPECIES: efflux RND transporter periplasmic adaptor subunit [unclassified Allomuricauda]MEC3966686.1 efflux RND transporter periplasmic adaptor subunit [Muricauda sp. SYSU M86414]MEC4266508.1 efflux RND transporter periplasmic adaptor subunit [Muricauda sp. SYSU M84420]